jgi:Flp pilus assembly protein CpaB
VAEAPPPPSKATFLVAARPLRAGTLIKPEDFAGQELEVDSAPAGARRDTREARAEIFKDVTKHPAKYIGKELTVRFQELSDDGIPRFPVGISFRDYE